MRRALLAILLVFLSLCQAAEAAVILFDTDPFAGSTALTTPGRQVVGGEQSVSFSIASDIFAFDKAVFGAYGVGDQVLFANALAENLPASGLNVIVLQTFDNDNDPTTPFNAGVAANLIAERITSPGAGFFVYFNQGLDLPRLVFSTDLSDNTADLKILARMTNLTGQAGRDAIPTFTEANFAIVEAAPIPEPATLMLAAPAALWALGPMRRRWRTRG